MGINGLLKVLSPLLIPENEELIKMSQQHRGSKRSRPMHNIRQFKDKTLAIDASSWLYKASYATAERLVEAVEADRKDPVCERILCKYMVKRCEELLTHASIRRLYLVFDGKRCPMKVGTNKERDDRRKVNLEEARRLKRLGMKSESEDKYKTCLKVVPWMAESVAKAVHEKWGNENKSRKTHFHSFSTEPRVKCLFSPYEADAQLAKLCVDGVVDAVVTEDSDVLVYSAACNKSFPIIYKLDRNNGECDVISMDWLLGSTTLTAPRFDRNDGLPSIKRNLLQLEPPAPQKETGKPNDKGRSKIARGSAMLSHLQGLSSREGRKKGSGARMFVQACVLSGCDYAPSQLSGVGIVSAFKMIKENAHRDTNSRFLHILKLFPREKFLMTDNGDGEDNDLTLSAGRDGIADMVEKYGQLLAKSESVFYYHRVLDQCGEVVPLVDVGEKGATGFLPCMARFEGDESFIGDLDVYVSKNEMAATAGGRRGSLPLTPAPARNPYRSLRDTKSPEVKSRSPQRTWKRKTPTNMFSLYARGTTAGVNSSARELSLLSTSRLEEVHNVDMRPRKEIPISSSYNSQGLDVMAHDKQPHQKYIAIDDSSDEEIEEASPFSGSLRRVKSRPSKCADFGNPLDDVDSSSSLSSISYQEVNNNGLESLRSKYFSNDIHTHRQKLNSIKSDSSCTDEVCNVRAMVTPPQSQHNADLSLVASDDSNNDDDDDCIILEDTSNPLPSMSRQSTQAQSSRPRLKPSILKTRSHRTSKRSRSIAMRKGKGLGKATKRTRSTSIRSFFEPLSTNAK